MEFGVGYFPTHDGIRPGTRRPPGRGARSGRDLLRRAHPHPGRPRDARSRPAAELPRKYWHCYDLFVALTAAAAATTRLRIGSGVCLVIERDPIITAKEVASVDHLSGGRLDFGVGTGWNREEMATTAPIRAPGWR